MVWRQTISSVAIPPPHVQDLTKYNSQAIDLILLSFVSMKYLRTFWS